MIKKKIPAEGITWQLEFKSIFTNKFNQKEFLDYIILNMG